LLRSPAAALQVTPTAGPRVADAMKRAADECAAGYHSLRLLRRAEFARRGHSPKRELSACVLNCVRYRSRPIPHGYTNRHMVAPHVITSRCAFGSAIEQRFRLPAASVAALVFRVASCRCMLDQSCSVNPSEPAPRVRHPIGGHLAVCENSLKNFFSVNVGRKVAVVRFIIALVQVADPRCI
jgi:hypothetical protein